jgi:Ca2+-transporting ATPase
MPASNFNIVGLSPEEVLDSRKKNGSNTLEYKKENAFLDALKSLAKEPMVILLLIASAIYFIRGNTGDGIFLASAVVLVAGISLFQDSRSRNALEKLKDFTKPTCTVIRNGKEEQIKSEDLVVGDCLMVEEGTSIAADGIIIHSNDFSVNESILTGESLAVYKHHGKKDNIVFKGTTVASGLAIVTITAIGGETELGKIGKSLETIKEEKTPLELQVGNFVKRMVIAGAVVFLIVWAINYMRSYALLDSLLKALTLAMSILPEEIPVALTTFMALGAWKLMKMGIVVKQMKTVETLGSATVICTDKTGTLTENKMALARLYVHESNTVSTLSADLSKAEQDLLTCAMWASEPIPFDPMEVALHEAYAKLMTADVRGRYKMVHEYPLGGKPPMMTHIFEDASGNRIIAAKGAPEALMQVSNLSSDEKLKIEKALNAMASEGYRLLGVGETNFTGSNFPAKQQEYPFKFLGLVAFYDPPKKNIHAVLEHFYAAGIAVKIVTGDNSATTAAIAKQIGFRGAEPCLTGDDIMALSDTELQKAVEETQVFTRMFPEAKLKIINALKAKNEIVAMTGDGVNDAPALKSAHIGIAMGKKGTEIAKQAASLILLEDDLSKMVDAVAMGRKIYTNLKKAIRYIISIHIPLILTVFIPLAFGWIYPNIFSPIHILFMELIMGPTCSIIYAHEPIEKNTMLQKPRPFSTTFFNLEELTTSIIQGLVITAGSLFIYRFAVYQGYNESMTRTMVFTVLVAANIFLTLINRSFYYSVISTMKYKNNLVLLIIAITLVLSGLMLYAKPLTAFFEFDTMSLTQLAIATSTGFVSVIWYEAIKWFKRKKDNSQA